MQSCIWLLQKTDAGKVYGLFVLGARTQFGLHNKCLMDRVLYGASTGANGVRVRSSFENAHALSVF